VVWPRLRTHTLRDGDALGPIGTEPAGWSTWLPATVVVPSAVRDVLDGEVGLGLHRSAAQVEGHRLDLAGRLGAASTAEARERTSESFTDGAQSEPCTRRMRVAATVAARTRAGPRR
jgi:hypothetical protein